MARTGYGARLAKVILTTLVALLIVTGISSENTDNVKSDNNSTTGDCLRGFEECPWCVAIYRDGGEVSRGERTASGLYCGGAMIGNRVVLTSAKCINAVQSEGVRVRVPASADPNKDYAVIKRIMHPTYSPKIRANDLALMVLNEDVAWDYGVNNGACIELETPMNGECQVVGFSDTEEIVLTTVVVKNGGCRMGKGGERACGTVKENECTAAAGAPVLCPYTRDDQGGLVLMGVVRMHCVDGKVLLGEVKSHAGWLNRELKKLGVQPQYYRA